MRITLLFAIGLCLRQMGFNIQMWETWVLVAVIGLYLAWIDVNEARK